MKVLVLFLTISASLLLGCSEKRPVEPYRESCQDLYGSLYPPEGARLPVRQLTIRTLGGSCCLNRDLSFCIPGDVGDRSGVIVAAVNDTVPVMLGYVFPRRFGDYDVNAAPLPPDWKLRNIVGGAGGGVRISGASTALALVMMSPFLGGASSEERYGFAIDVIRHEEFDRLTADVEAALTASPQAVFDPEVNPGLFSKAGLILFETLYIGNEEASVQPEGVPYVLDRVGDLVDIVNPTTLSYGVRVAPEGGESPDSVFLVAGREIDAIIHRGPLTVTPYMLGTGRFDIGFYKGFGGFSKVHLLDPSHAGGVATRANAVRTLWYALTAAVECPWQVDPGSSAILDSAWVESLADAIEGAYTSRVLDLAFDYLSVHSHIPGQWLGLPAADSLDSQRYLSTVRPILEANTARLENIGVAGEIPFYKGLFTSAYHESLLVCQINGVIVPCENAPVLTGGWIWPGFGLTDTVFTYAVDYYDQEGQPPSSIVVVIDGEGREMGLSSGAAADGRYEYSTLLDVGLHTYYFRATDTHGDMGRLPSAGVFEGPSVGSYPELTEGSVLPTGGLTTDVFSYNVTYRDLDRSMPNFVRVVIDDEAHRMELGSGKPYDGVYAYRTQLSAGCHEYYFDCEDAGGIQDRLPETGCLDGPCVAYAPGLSNGRVVPAAGTPITDFSFQVDYYQHDGHSPTVVKVFVDDIGYAMSLQSGTPGEGTYATEMRLGEGQHTHRFYCMAMAGVETFLPDSGSFGGPMVSYVPGKNPDAKLAVHVRTHSSKGDCDCGTIESCSDIVTTCLSGSVDAFPVFFDLIEYQGVEYGLTWPDWTYSAAWHSCADQTIGEIRRPGDGVTQMWNECHSEAVAVPGYVWLYADGAGLVCPYGHPSSGGVRVFDCSGGADWAIWPFCAGVYGAAGDDPCWHVPHPGRQAHQPAK